MTFTQSAFRPAAIFILISAFLHILAPVAEGTSPEALRLVPLGILWFAIGYGIARGWRWLAYLAFLLLSAGAIFALSHVWSPTALPAWWFLGIVVANFLAVLSLLAVLWN